MDIEQVKDTASLNEYMAEHNLRGYWAMERRAAELQPYLWKWADIEPAITKAGEVMSIEEAFRRNIGLVNPRNAPGLMSNLTVGLQCVMPGESAPQHRHSASAIRFVIKGSPDAYTIGAGEPMPLHEGDLITNPHLTFHGHVSEADAPVIWIDGLDGRFAHLGKEFRADYDGPDGLARERIGQSYRTMGHVRPTSLGQTQNPPPFRYPWTETQAALDAMQETEAEPDPHDGYHLTFCHPLTGGPTLPTAACEITLLPGKFAGRAHRHNSTVVYHAFRGQGVTVVDGERFDWSKGDFLAIPPWAEHRHENASAEGSILFSFTDWPAMKALGLWDEEES